MESKRDDYIDIVKGIAIISIVVGHALNTDVYYSTIANELRKFVYIYHIAAFLFCAGMVYKTKNIKSFLKGQIKNYLKTMTVVVVSLFLVPLWIHVGALESYSLREVIYCLKLSVLYYPTGQFVGALWFMPFFTVCLIIFALNSYIKKTGRIPNQIFESLLIFEGGWTATRLLQGWNYSLLVL